MKRLVIALTLLFCFNGFLVAQTAKDSTGTDPKAWKISSDINLTQTQNTYSDNWEGDESGSISWAFNLNFLAEKQLSTTLNSRNTMKLAFGQTHTQVQETNDWLVPAKSTDLIDLESVLRYQFGGFVDPYISGHLVSQFTDKRDPDKVHNINPITLTEAIGAAKDLLKNDDTEWIARLGFGARQLFDRNALQADSTRDSKTTTDAGFEFVSELKTPLVKDRLKLTSKLIIFQAVTYSEADELEGLEEEDYWKSPDINFENIFTANITKYVMVNLYTQLLYDKQVDKGGRFKETLSLGLTYTLF